MPTYIHCSNISGQWNARAVTRMATTRGVGFVVFEKVHGLLAAPVNTSAETKIAAGCALVKAAAAAAGTQAPDCYQYVEVDWARTYYSLGHEVDADPGELAMHWPNGTLFGRETTIAWNPGDAPLVNGSHIFKCVPPLAARGAAGLRTLRARPRSM